MRIVGGEFRGRALAQPHGLAIRPTSDRLRETLFNVLHHGYGLPRADTRVLDLFAGTGALGLEALSRGAIYALFVEASVEGRGLLRRNIEALGLTGRTRIFRRDATRLGDVGTIAPFGLVFCDPPYRKGLGEKALTSAAAGGWLTAGALCVLEEAAEVEVRPGPDFTRLEQRASGETQLVFLEWGKRRTGYNPV